MFWRDQEMALFGITNYNCVLHQLVLILSPPDPLSSRSNNLFLDPQHHRIRWYTSFGVEFFLVDSEIMCFGSFFLANDFWIQKTSFLIPAAVCSTFVGEVIGIHYQNH